MNAIELLEQLAQAESQAQLINAHFAQVRETILTPEIKAQLAQVDEEQAQASAAIVAGINSLREQVKTAVIATGATVKGSMFQAVYIKGRDSVDIAGLKGYAKVHPEVLEFIETGAPSVTIRGVK